MLGAGSVALQSFRFRVLLETYRVKKKPAEIYLPAFVVRSKTTAR